jgi:hypothetical protein
MDEDDALMEEVRKVLRAMLGQPDPEPVTGPPIVPSEGRSTGAPRILPDQYSRDFLRRINGTTPTFADRLPED